MNFSKLDAFFEQMTERGYPACEIAVTKDGKTVYRKGVGFADAAKTRPVSDKDLYWIFSATKVLTCIAAMQLVEQGKINLSDPVSKYIPEFANLTVKNKDGSLTPAQNAMTVEHLFTMQGGMNYNLKAPELQEAISRGAGTVELVKEMAKVPLSFEPGTHYQYSLCHDVLGAIVEIASGERFCDYMQKHIFDPVGAKDIGFFPTDEQKSRFSAMYSIKTGDNSPYEVELVNRFRLTPNYDSGGAGLFSSVDDYIKVISVIACGGTTPDGYRMLSPESIRMMGENRLCPDSLDDYVKNRLYGYGWGLCGRAHVNPTVSLSRSPIGEFGWDGAANALSLIDPINHVAIYFGTQVLGFQYGYLVIHPVLRNLVYECLDS